MIIENTNNIFKFCCKCFMLIIILILCCYIYMISSNIVTYYNQNNNDNIIDLWRKTVGSLDKEKYKALYVTINYIPLILIFLIIIINIVHLKLKKKCYFVHMLLGECFLIILNAIAQIITILPDSNNTRPICNNSNLSELNYWIFTRISTNFCGDMMWSGHMYHTLFMLIILYMILNEYNFFIKKIFYIISGLIIIFEANGLIMFKIHYSVDVYISILVTPLIFFNQKFNVLVYKTIDWIIK